MNCPKCTGEMNPINVKGSILECLDCGYRSHLHHPDLDVVNIGLELDTTAACDLPWLIHDTLDEDCQ
jgi:hypothetical protein